MDEQNTALSVEVSAPARINLLFRHKTIRRFKVGKFEFKNNQLRITDPDDAAEFEKILNGLPPIESRDIVIVNEEAAAAAERPATSSAVRGTMVAGDILTAKDRERLAADQAQKSTTGGLQIGLGGMSLPKK